MENQSSPEKLEAQLNLPMSPNTVGQTIIKQNQELKEANKKLCDQIKEVLEIVSTLKLEIQNLSANSSLGAHDEIVTEDDSKTNSNVSLPQQNDTKTGEEDEEQLFNCRAKLFTFDSNAKELKERGLGNIQLLRHKTTEKLRLVMRREETLTLCLNHAVTSDLEVVPHRHKKTWLFWSAADYSNGKIEYHLFACHFKTPEIVSDFKNALDGALAESTDDIEILYENLVPEEDKEFAKKLQLPEKFLAYKQKEGCSGCRGCSDELFCEHAKLYKFDRDDNEWKEKGVGEIKVVLDAERGGYKLYLQYGETVLDCLLTPDIKFVPQPTSDRVWTWTAQKSNGTEQLAARFKSCEIAKRFKQVVNVIQECLREVRNEESDLN